MDAPPNRPPLIALPRRDQTRALPRWRLALGGAGAGCALLLLAWLPAGLLPAVPSMLEVFGPTGIRYPAAAAVAGLLTASIALSDL